MKLTSRRTFMGISTAGLLTGCAHGAAYVRLLSRPSSKPQPVAAGTHALELRRERDSLLYVPKSVDLEQPAPLLVYLHGATGAAPQAVNRLGAFADQFGILLLGPASEGTTWDAIGGGYGADVQEIDRALSRAFSMSRVDPRRIALCGFSDGASYALGLGLSNGDLFDSVIAFSPGFIPAGAQQNGKPRLFVSHGTADTILPIDSCSRRFVPGLKRAGYEVNYREFDGPHTIPRDVAEEAMKWYLRKSG